MPKYLLAIVLALSVLPGCASKKLTPADPVAAAALKADAIVIRLNEVQGAAIQACGPEPECRPEGGISTPLFRDLLRTFIKVRTTLKTVPVGWQATVKTAWQEARPSFNAVTNPAIIAALGLVDALIGGL